MGSEITIFTIRKVITISYYLSTSSVELCEHWALSSTTLDQRRVLNINMPGGSFPPSIQEVLLYTSKTYSIRDEVNLS